MRSALHNTLKRKGAIVGLIAWLLPVLILAQSAPQKDSIRQSISRLGKFKPSLSRDTLLATNLFELHRMSYNQGPIDSEFVVARRIAQLAGIRRWPKGVFLGHMALANSYMDAEQWNNATRSFLKAVIVARSMRNDSLLGVVYRDLAGNYEIQTKPNSAIHYYKLAYRLLNKAGNFNEAVICLNQLANFEQARKDTVAALRYFKECLTISRSHGLKVGEILGLSGLADIYLASGPRQQGLLLLKQAARLAANIKHYNFMAQFERQIGLYYVSRQQFKLAQPYLEHAYEVLVVQKKGNYTNMLATDLNQTLYETHKQLGQTGKALTYLERRTALIDSMLQDRSREEHDAVQAQLVLEKQQIDNRNLRIRELEQANAIKTRTTYFLWAISGLLLVLLGVAGWSSRQQKHKNQLLTEKKAELEKALFYGQVQAMTALRAQMNPHFIFNCLNSIQYFSAQNNAERASDYLAKFARLIRLVLENSKSEKVTLENELETLRLYTDLEAMRFEQKVHYTIEVDAEIIVEDVEIPPLLLQPFVENAIWHGLMHKPEGGTISIVVQLARYDLIHVEITDDGVGRARAADYKRRSVNSYKSVGLQLTADRIKLINRLYHTHTQVEVQDLFTERGEPSGTRVIVEIPI
ncbi:histidine kinase [uncultured Fibrella sp.]|uniref:tetratricopeptide repeat-containing sensor histidine kinase n=1 Tax=uncultured Fibrella sp. TaxID=1284596 RepID=UPI0035CC295D